MEVAVTDRYEIFADERGQQMRLESVHDIIELKRGDVTIFILIVSTKRLKRVDVVKILPYTQRILTVYLSIHSTASGSRFILSM